MKRKQMDGQKPCQDRTRACIFSIPESVFYNIIQFLTIAIQDEMFVSHSSDNRIYSALKRTTKSWNISKFYELFSFDLTLHQPNPSSRLHAICRSEIDHLNPRAVLTSGLICKRNLHTFHVPATAHEPRQPLGLCCFHKLMAMSNLRHLTMTDLATNDFSMLSQLLEAEFDFSSFRYPLKLPQGLKRLRIGVTRLNQENLSDLEIECPKLLEHFALSCFDTEQIASLRMNESLESLCFIHLKLSPRTVTGPNLRKICFQACSCGSLPRLAHLTTLRVLTLPHPVMRTEHDEHIEPTIDNFIWNVGKLSFVEHLNLPFLPSSAYPLYNWDSLKTIDVQIPRLNKSVLRDLGQLTKLNKITHQGQVLQERENEFAQFRARI
jgi:hypothetical protein